MEAKEISEILLPSSLKRMRADELKTPRVSTAISIIIIIIIIIIHYILVLLLLLLLLLIVFKCAFVTLITITYLLTYRNKEG